MKPEKEKIFTKDTPDSLHSLQSCFLHKGILSHTPYQRLSFWGADQKGTHVTVFPLSAPKITWLIKMRV